MISDMDGKCSTNRPGKRETIGRTPEDRDAGHRRVSREGELITRFRDSRIKPFGLTTMTFQSILKYSSWNYDQE